MNNPHRLIRLDVPKEDLQGSKACHFVVVITQYERKNPITFTLRAHSGARLDVNELPMEPYKFVHPKQVGQWPEGCRGKVTYSVSVRELHHLSIPHFGSGVLNT